MQRTISPADLKNAKTKISELEKEKLKIETRISEHANILLEHGALNPNYIKMKEFGNDLVSIYFSDKGEYSFQPKLFYIMYTRNIEGITQAVMDVKATLPESYQESISVRDMRINLNITTPEKTKPLLFLNIDNNKRRFQLANEFEMQEGFKLAEALKIMRPLLEREFDSLKIKYATSFSVLDKITRH